MTVAFSVTKNYYQYLPAVLCSLYSSNIIDKCYIFIEDDALTLPFVNVEYINMHKIPELSADNPNYDTHFSVASLCRLFLPKLITEDKVLYLDIDLIVLKNLNELWEMDVSEYYAAGVVDKNIKVVAPQYADVLNLDKYINSGVLLLNLKKIREDKMDDRLIGALGLQKFAFPDQDIINLIFKDKILLLPNKFNSSLVTDIAHDFYIYHWTGNKTNWVYDREFRELWNHFERSFISNFVKVVNKDGDS